MMIYLTLLEAGYYKMKKSSVVIMSYLRADNCCLRDNFWIQHRLQINFVINLSYPNRLRTYL